MVPLNNTNIYLASPPLLTYWLLQTLELPYPS